MPLETFNYLDSLVVTNPTVTDGCVNGDDHIRGIKSTLKATFPNITGAITATQADLNTVAAWASGGAAVLKGAGAFFNVNTTDGFLNTLAGDIDVQLQGSIAATFQRTVGVNTLKVFGGITATGEIKGPGITPIGAAVLWFEDTLPSDGLWVWANGQVIASANTVAPVLLARWGSRFGGNGTTTMGVPDLRETVPIGKATMGATTQRNLISLFTQTVKDAIGTFFGEGAHLISALELPAHRHGVFLTDPGHHHPYTSQGAVANQTPGGAFPLNTNPTATNTGDSFTGITISDGSGGLNQTTVAGASASMNIVQPSTPVNFIIRLG